MDRRRAGGDDLFGKRLYPPDVLLTYFALGGLSYGLFLYGLNVARRGQPWVGYLLSALAAVTFTRCSQERERPLPGRDRPRCNAGPMVAPGSSSHCGNTGHRSVDGAARYRGPVTTIPTKVWRERIR